MVDLSIHLLLDNLVALDDLFEKRHELGLLGLQLSFKVCLHPPLNIHSLRYLLLNGSCAGGLRALFAGPHTGSANRSSGSLAAIQAILLLLSIMLLSGDRLALTVVRQVRA